MTGQEIISMSMKMDMLTVSDVITMYINMKKGLATLLAQRR